MKKIEILDKRKRREKHYLQEDGTFIAELYDEDIHYPNNGKYEEIDNTLELENGYYVNKSNDYKVYFSNIVDSEIMRIEQNGHYIITSLKKYKDYSIEKEKNTSMLYDNIKYIEVLKNIDISYDVTPSKVKENIFINDIDADIDNLIFEIKTDLDLELRNNVIVAKNKNKEIFNLESPYMIDAESNISDSIYYTLLKKDNSYELKINLDYEWIQKSKFPIIIDPTIVQYSNTNSVVDTYIYEGDNGVIKSDLGYLKVGVENINNQYRKNRALLWFELPELGTGSQVINATLRLTSYPGYPQNPIYDIIDIYRMTTEWKNSEAYWNNLYNQIDEKIEGTFFSYRTYSTTNGQVSTGGGEANITQLVQKWYTSLDNYGIMLKLSKEQFKNEIIPMFLSKENTFNSSRKPLLIITYRNQNGLENYMNYETYTLTKGKTYHNLFNGNLTGVFDLISTKKSTLPINLKLIYNTNDVVLSNNYGCGVGYKFNYYQTIKEEIIDETTYLKYLDCDGTYHYFSNTKTILNNGIPTNQTYENKFFDEDGLGFEIELVDGYYILTDKNLNKSKFEISNNIGYLTMLEDNNSNKVFISYDSNNRITNLSTSDNEQITIEYNNNNITISYENDEVILSFINNKINSIEFSVGLIYISYIDGLLSNIVDMDNKSVQYQYYDKEPFKLKKIIEYSVNNNIGRYYESFYNFLSTKLMDNKNRIKVISFNEKGNPISISYQNNNNNLKNAYGIKYDYNNNDLKINYLNNKMMSIGNPLKSVINLIDNSSFESSDTVFSVGSGATITHTTEEKRSGLKSLKFTSTSDNSDIYKIIELENDNNYTFSGYIKTTSNNIELNVYYENENNNYILLKNELIKSSNDFERFDLSFNIPSSSSGNVKIQFTSDNNSIMYLDDVQLEEGLVANHYNLIDNSDFSKGLSMWDLYTGSGFNINDIFSVEDVNINQKALKISMNSSNSTSVEREMNISGETGNKFTLSFWYKNEGVVSSEYWDDINVPQNYVSLDLYPTTPLQTDAYNYIKALEPSNDGWHFFIHEFTAAYDFDKIILKFGQSMNVNNLYITNINLFKDIRKTSCNYNEDGTVNQIKTIDNKTINYYYNKNNYLTKINNTDTKIKTIEYDNQIKSRILSGTNENGLVYMNEYDNNGNLKCVELGGKKQLIDIADGTYVIRSKGSNMCLSLRKQIELFFESDIHAHNKWVLEEVNINQKSYYKIYHSIINNNYLSSNSNNEVVIDNYNGNYSLFEFIKQDDGSFYIKNKENGLYIKKSTASIEFNNIVSTEDNDEFKFYIEYGYDEKFIENTYDYSQTGNFLKKQSLSPFSVTSFNFDSETGLIDYISDLNDNKIFYQFNNKNQITLADLGEKSISYEYNTNNLLSKIIDENREYNFEYDEFLNIKCVKINNSIILFNNVYENNNGNLLSTTFGNNHTILYEYDIFDRLKKITKQNGYIEYYYDNDGKISKIISPEETLKYIYDLSGKINKFYEDNFLISYSYDSDSNVTSKKIELDNLVKTITSTYENDNLISSFIDNDEIDYEYDSLGRLTNYNINDELFNNYTYIDNGKNATTFIKTKENNYGLYKYQYDKLGNIKRIYKDNNLTNEYYYDKFGKLKTENDYNHNNTIRYSYDLNDNILKKKKCKINTYDVISEVNYEYDSNWTDKLIKIDNHNIQYDSLGNITSIDNNQLFNWINGRQLNQYTKNNIVTSYDYNKDGVRVKKNTNGLITRYFLENNRICIENRNGVMIYYVRDVVGNLLGFDYNNIRYYYIKNALDDIVGIVDSNDNIVAKYEYDSWGNILSITDGLDNDVRNIQQHIANINPFRYRGYYYDVESDLYYLNKRYYSPYLSRFICTDEYINQESIYLNLYCYCSNDPINNIDPNGNSWFKKAGSFVLNYCLRGLSKVVNTIITVKNTITKIYDYVSNLVNISTKKTTPAPSDKYPDYQSVGAPYIPNHQVHATASEINHIKQSDKALYDINVETSIMDASITLSTNFKLFSMDWTLGVDGLSNNITIKKDDFEYSQMLFNSDPNVIAAWSYITYNKENDKSININHTVEVGELIPALVGVYVGASALQPIAGNIYEKSLSIIKQLLRSVIYS